MKRFKHLFIRLSIILIGFGYGYTAQAQNLLLHYGLSGDRKGNNKNVTDESGNGFKGKLYNGAFVSSFKGIPVIDLGTSNGYIDLGAKFGRVVKSLTDYSAAIKIFIPETSDISKNGNFIWSFSNSIDILKESKGCLFLSAKNTRYAISPTNYAKESGIQNGAPINKGSWQTIVFVQKDGIGRVFINGCLAANGKISMTPSALGETMYNFLGRSSYRSDSYLVDAKIAYFKIYDAPLSSEQVEDLSGLRVNYNGTSVLARFDFNNLQDSAGIYTGTLKNGAKLVEYNGLSVLTLGEKSGYFDIGPEFGKVIAQLDSFSISSNLYIPVSTKTGEKGNFVWTFANSTDMASSANGSLFFEAGNSKYSISKKHWSGESSVLFNKGLPKGEWINVTYTQYNDIGKVYINGNLRAQGTISVKPKELGATSCNFLGRSCYKKDNFLQSAEYDNFIVYQGVLNKSQINKLSEKTVVLNNVIDSLYLIDARAQLEIPHANSLNSSIILPSVIGNGVSISWQSSNPEVVSLDGLVTRPGIGKDPVQVTLTATLRYNNSVNTKQIDVTVLPGYSDAVSVQKDIANLQITGNTNNIRRGINLPIKTLEGSNVVWESDSPEFLSHGGKVVQLSPLGKGRKKVLLTAKLQKGKEVAKKDFEVWVAEEESFKSYLFSYFTGNSSKDEQIHFAVSNDGYNYSPLNNGNPIISSDTISMKKGVRDPHILRAEDGKTFYMVVTDMKSAEGWSSNRGMVLLKSNDLINWTSSTVHFPSKWSETWANVLRVWAPQTIYDPVSKKYVVYFSLFTGDATCPYDRIYYCYANDDFTDLTGEPQILFDRGTSTIDGDIVFNNSDSLFYLFFKNESLGGISQVTAKTLIPSKGEPGSQWSEPSKPLQQTDEAVEGSGVFRLINSNDWILMYDCYSNGHYQFCSSKDLKNFTFVKDIYNMNARHGTTIPIYAEELERLMAKWPSSTLSNLPLGTKSLSVRENGCDIDSSSKTIKMALSYGTDLTKFDPMLFASPGTLISPSGPQDFSTGAVNYTFTQNGVSSTYKVSATIKVNPVIPGFHADPDILYSEKTKRFYIYPTSDGFPGWGGYYFNVFSSPDLVHWNDEGTFLDLSTNQVPWATGNAWAPCIEEKKMEDGSYRYFFYFSGNAGIKKIGVAVANDPTGPFFDLGSPMIAESPEGANGQIIDGDVFTDPVSGKSYFYWGNGYLAVAELNDDMVSLKDNTVKIITPAGGSLEDYAYREAPYVIFRDGVYYFLWSVDDTGSDNYHIAYGTSSSPLGPIQVASSPVVIIQEPDQKIYGTGHNSILKIPGKDEWYIVYHRINEHYISNGPGFHREVCIDKIEFDEDGTIKQVVPTHRGIDPVSAIK